MATSETFGAYSHVPISNGFDALQDVVCFFIGYDQMEEAALKLMKQKLSLVQNQNASARDKSISDSKTSMNKSRKTGIRITC